MYYSLEMRNYSNYDINITVLEISQANHLMFYGF